MNQKNIILLGLLLAPLYASASSVLYSEDFITGYTVGTTLTGQTDTGGRTWATAPGANSGLVTTGVGLSGLVAGAGSAWEGNSLGGALSLGVNDTNLVIDISMRARNANGYGTFFFVGDASNDRLIGFGGGEGGLQLFGASSSSTFLPTAVWAGNVGNNDGLLAAHHVRLDYRLSYDFVTETGALAVRNPLYGTDYTEATTFTSAQLGAGFSNTQSDWSSLQVYGRVPADTFADGVLTVSSVPEASVVSLIVGGACVSLIARRIFKKN